MKYREFTCEWCGKVAVDMRRGGKTQKYCSKECKETAYNFKNGCGGGSCLYNDAVICSAHKCKNCGWNPAVEQIRKEAMV